jgi:CheY-like chemotaxis protein
MQGGVVEARSAGPGRGSEFIVRMPLADVRKPEPPAKVEPAPAAKTAKSKRILVVDDSRDQAQSLGLLLKLLGHDVRTDYDGATALETAKQFKPDIVLLDIGLPKMNGYEVARRIREIPALKNVLLVAQTGWGQEEHRRRSIEAGFDHHFVKPVSIESLEEILQQQHTTTEKKS